jgi:hypothetical protein
MSFEVGTMTALDAGAVAAAGFKVDARLVRAPYPDVEVQTSRAYLLARRVGEPAET